MNPQIATIRDPATSSSAQILVSQGFNCFRFTAMKAGKPIEVLYSPADFASGQSRPSRGGIPLMFPFPGRIPGTTLSWEGKTYTQEPGDAFGNAIHGFVMWRPWRVVEQSESKVVGQLHAWKDDPGLKERWPADFRLTATYEMAGNTLRSEFVIDNPGNVPLPCGFGTHPYFRVPLGGAKAEDCIVQLPVTERWELKDMLPTGRRLAVSDAAQLQQGMRYGELQLDDAFTGLQIADDGCASGLCGSIARIRSLVGLQTADRWCAASITDPASGCTVTQRWDDTFRECVVYTPPHREAICIEPLTCVPSAFDLTARGIDAGLKIVPPGGSFAARVEISAA
jgi:aldose 1-epimerase